MFYKTRDRVREGGKGQEWRRLDCGGDREVKEHLNRKIEVRTDSMRE